MSLVSYCTKPLFYILLFCAIALCCTKTQSTNKKLKFQTLAEIRKRLAGEWQMHYAVGGITGNEIERYSETYVFFGKNDSLRIMLRGEPWARDRILWVRQDDIFNELTHVITFNTLEGAPYSWIADDIQKDTLRIVANAYDSYVYFLTQVR